MILSSLSHFLFYREPAESVKCNKLQILQGGGGGGRKKFHENFEGGRGGGGGFMKV